MTLQQLSKARELATAGATRNQIAAAIGQHPASVWRNADKIGLSIRRIAKKTPYAELDKQRKVLLDLWNTGVAASALATRMNCSRRMMKKWLVAQGIELETRPAKGDKNGNWNGGRWLDDNGYVYVWIDRKSDPFSIMIPKGRNGSSIMEHRLIMAQHLGRALTKNETVHHINGNREDNRIENLQLRRTKHGPGQVFFCNNCSSTDIGTKQL